MEPILLEMKPIQQQPDELPLRYPEAGGFAASEITSLFFIGFISFWTIAVVTYAVISKSMRETMQQRFKLSSHQSIPCHRCRFFNSNPYLKCAIQPSIALTQQAIDCSDYRDDGDSS